MFNLLSRYIFLRSCVPELYVLWTQKHQIATDFAWILVQILFLLIKLNNFALFQGEISKYWIFKNISCPGEKVFKSRNREASRRLRNAELDDISFFSSRSNPK